MSGPARRARMAPAMHRPPARGSPPRRQEGGPPALRLLMKRLPITLLGSAILAAAIGLALTARPDGERATEAPPSARAGKSSVPAGAARAAASSSKAALQRAEQAGIDINSVIETVSHRVAPTSGHDRLAAEDRLYRADFSPAGFSLTLREQLSRKERAARTRAWRASRPPEPEGSARVTRPSRSNALPAEAIPFAPEPAFSVETSTATLGSRALALRPGAWQGSSNRAERTLLPGLLERVRAREGELEWDFVLARPLPGAGDLRIGARLAADAAPERSGRALRFRLPGGRSLLMGQLVVKDASGRTLHRALPSTQQGRLHLSVPAAVLAEGRYPLTLDPTISPSTPSQTNRWLPATRSGRRSPGTARTTSSPGRTTASAQPTSSARA